MNYSWMVGCTVIAIIAARNFQVWLKNKNETNLVFAMYGIGLATGLLVGYYWIR